MNTLLTRFCLLLAGTNYTQSELMRLFADLEKMGRQRTVEEILFLREQARGNSVADEGNLLPPPVSKDDLTSATTRIVALLRDEAQLSTREAIAVLSSALKEKFPELRGNVLPPQSKKSLAVWIERVSRIVPERELLHLATVLRNRRVHAVSGDWTLKK